MKKSTQKIELYNLLAIQPKKILQKCEGVYFFNKDSNLKWSL